jgi:HlyD family secretion protein
VDDLARWRELGDGYRVESRIRVTRLENALVVPASALFRAEGAWLAFGVKADKATRRKVEIGARTPDWAEVKSGLKEGDQVVLYPSDQVVDGVEVAAQTARDR